MRILQLCSASLIGGGERHLADLSNSLARRGHDVFFSLRSVSPLSTELTYIPRDNLTFLPMRNALDIPSAFQIARLARRVKADLIHAHLARDYPLAAMSSYLSDVPYVITRHVLFPLKRLQKFMLARVAGVIAPSDAIYDSLTSRKILPAERVRKIRHGIDTERFSVVHRAVGRPFTVGTIGHLAPIKGHEIFIRAAEIALKAKPEMRFMILGEDKSRVGENRKVLTELIDRLHLQDKINLAGWADDVRLFFGEMDIFVSAARSEPFGLVMAEAMMSGVPVIATRSEGAMEIIESDVSGLLVPLDDPKVIADAMLKLEADPSLRKRLTDKARQRVTEHFSLSRMVDETEGFYRSILDANPNV